MILEIVYAFALGLLSIASPCIFVMIPVILSYIGSDAKKIVLFFTGHTIIFVLLGIIAALTGKLLTVALGRYLYLAAGAFTLFFGLARFGVVSLPMPKVCHPKNSKSSFVLGLLFGLICLGCLGPLLAAVLIFVVAKASVIPGALIMLSYGIGFSIPFIIFGCILTDKSLKKRLLHKEKALKIISGSLLLVASLYLLYLGLRGI
ncbi:sulfite exporter TauE/SafE family protein [Candidatus Woesearchaeota archaeon]|nr:sulfite exporter TauE/SafE family protein [Candidatus Woesearchaeota archaeon]